MAPGRQAGFTITEALITLLILAIGLAGVSRLQRETQRGFGQAKARSEALALAEQKLETLRAVTVAAPYEGNAGGQTLGLSGSNSRYDLFWRINPDVLGTSYRIRVTTRWRDQAGEQRIMLEGTVPATDPALPGQVLSSAAAP